jgi:hypothetical protein
MMKSTAIFSITALFFFLGFAPWTAARQEKQEEKATPPKQEEKAKPEKQQQAAKPEKEQHEQQAKPEKQQQQAKAPKQGQPVAKGQQEQEQKQRQEHTASAKPQTEHSQQQAEGQQQRQSQQQTVSSKEPQHTQEETARQHSQPELRLSARGSGRIPDQQFHSHFGRGHEFRMGDPVMVDGYSRFQYGGYWFGYVQPWPNGWYYTDQFYIDYADGGYYMYNPYYPGTRFAITVVI